MADPIIEQIAQAIRTQLLTISVDNGYETDVTDVVRPTRIGRFVDPKHLQIAMIQEDPEPYDDLSYPGNPPGRAWQQRYLLDCIVLSSDRETTPIAETINKFSADVIKALFADPQWATLALDTIVEAPRMLAEPGGPDGITIPLVIRYRVLENDPYTQA